MNVTTLQSSQATSRAAVNPERQAGVNLVKSLRTGDLDGARQAYAQIVQNAPEGATLQSGSAFASLGKALKAGDVDAAREVAKKALQDIRSSNGPQIPEGPVSGPAAAPAISTTPGTAGTLLNLVA